MTLLAYQCLGSLMSKSSPESKNYRIRCYSIIAGGDTIHLSTLLLQVIRSQITQSIITIYW